MTTAPNKPDRKLSNQLETQDTRVKIGLCNRLKLVFKWLSKEAGIALVALLATISWNFHTSHNTTKHYTSDLVYSYINSVRELILDQYHHGKEEKYPEISVEEIEAFLRAKTSNTLKALDQENARLWEFWLPKQTVPKQNLINFLSEAGIGFFPPYLVEDGYHNPNLIQNVCLDNHHLVDQHKYYPKDYKFHHFFCGINLQNVTLEGVNLTRIILEGANLKGAVLKSAILSQANLQEALLTDVDLSYADLTQANLKEAMILGNLESITLNRANLRDAELWSPQTCEEHNYDRKSDQGNLANCTNYASQKYTNTSLKNAKLLGANLQGAILREVDLTNAIMRESLILHRPDPKDEDKSYDHDQIVIKGRISTNLRNADLRQAILEGTDLRVANLRGADLRGVKKPNSIKLDNAIFDGTTKLPDWLKGKENEYQMIDVSGKQNLIQKDLSHMDLRDAFRCDEKDKDQDNKDEKSKCEKPISLKGTNFKGADLRGADLSITKKINTNEYQIDPEKLKGALYDDNTDLPFPGDKVQQEEEAKNKGMIKLPSVATKQKNREEEERAQHNAVNNSTQSTKEDDTDLDIDLSGADLRYVDLSGVNLSRAKLQGADLTGINFDKDTKFTNAQYSYEECRDYQATKLPFDRNTAVFHRMRLAINVDCLEQPIDLRKVNLRHSILISNNRDKPDNQQTKFDLKYADLREADLRDANWQNVDLTEADFMGAKLQNADLRNSTLDKTNFANANLKGAKLPKGWEIDAFLCNTIGPYGKVYNTRCNQETEDKSLNVSISFQE